MSNVDPQEVITWMTGQKEASAPIDVDVRDAKRRANAAKPKRAKRQRGSSGSGSE